MATQWIDIPSGNDSFGGYLSLPRHGSGPAVIIIQEIFGVNGHIRAVCDQYAAAGYVALAPDVFWRTQPRVELTYEGTDVKTALELAQETDVDLAVADIAATADLLRTLPEVSGKVAAVGFCMGGLFSYLVASTGKVDAAVAYTAAASRAVSMPRARSPSRSCSTTGRTITPSLYRQSRL